MKGSTIMRSNKIKLYKILPIISLIILTICFIFRYSYINFLGLNRPLQLAVYICTSLGIIGAISSMKEGIDMSFRGNILALMLINIIFIASYPILTIAETFVRPVENPYSKLAPQTTYTTKNRDDASFILEGEIYKWPLTMENFLSNGYDYRQIDDNKVSLSKYGESNQAKPTWFTDGHINQAVTESYSIELSLDGNGDIEEQNVLEFYIKALDNNWDFEVQGINLIDSIYVLEQKYGEDLKTDPNNKKNTLKYYYVETQDSYLISYGAISGKVQVIKIEKMH